MYITPAFRVPACDKDRFTTSLFRRKILAKFCDALTIRPVLRNAQIRVIGARPVFILPFSECEIRLDRNRMIWTTGEAYRYCRRAYFHEADNPRTGTRTRKNPPPSLPTYIYISRVCILYTFTHTSTHVRTFGRGYAGRLHLYTDVLGTEIWRDPLDSTRLAIIQFIGLSKAPVHAVFPDRSLSLPLFLCLSPAPLPSRFLPRSLSPFFSLSRMYFPPPFLLI